jgi:hypothetical protein
VYIDHKFKETVLANKDEKNCLISRFVPSSSSSSLYRVE